MHKQLLIKKSTALYAQPADFLLCINTTGSDCYRFMPVYVTPLMVIRSVQQSFSGDKPTWKHTWVSFFDKDISPTSDGGPPSEDNRFAEHNGFDLVEIKKAMKENETRKRKQGSKAPSVSRQPRMCSYGRRNLRGYAKGSKSTLRFSSNSSGRKSESWKSISTL